MYKKRIPFHYTNKSRMYLPHFIKNWSIDKSFTRKKIDRSVYHNRLDNKNGVVTKADAFYNNSIIILLFIHSV